MFSEALLGAEVGTHIVIIWGELVGLETADFLSEKGKNVTVVRKGMNRGGKLWPFRITLLNRLVAKGVTFLTGVIYDKVTEEGLIIVKDGKGQYIEAGTIAIAAGSKPDTALFKSLKDKRWRSYCVGDYLRPHSIRVAIHDGADIALKV